MVHMTRQFCYMCGNKTEEKRPRVYWCDNCQQTYYDNPKPCADLYLFDDQDRLIIGRRKYEPSKGMLDIPGGFLDFDELFEEGAVREIKEELNLGTSDFSKPIYLTSYHSLYPWGKETYQTVVAVFVARLKPGAEPKAMDDIEGLFRAKPAELRREDFGFPEQADQAIIALKLLQDHNG